MWCGLIFLQAILLGLTASLPATSLRLLSTPPSRLPNATISRNSEIEEPRDPLDLRIGRTGYFVRFSHYRDSSRAFSAENIIHTLRVARFDATHPHPLTTWMPKRLFVYNTAAVDLQVVPIQIRWTEWDDALGAMLFFYENFEPVQLLFSVHNTTGGKIARGFVQETYSSV